MGKMDNIVWLTREQHDAKHSAFLNEHYSPLVVSSDDRNEIIQTMANHLIAGMISGLDISDETDVIRYLANTPERYRANIVCMNMDRAIKLARETVALATFGGL